MFITNKEKTVAHIFRENKYATGMVGKWHLGLYWEHIGGDVWKVTEMTKKTQNLL